MTNIIIKASKEQDALTIALLRRQIWETTYRGIYQDALIDGYDVEQRRQRDLAKIQGERYDVYVVMADGEAVGYFSMERAWPPVIASLYLLATRQHQGIGKRIFSFIRDYCRKRGADIFRCNCNTHNTPAQGFYKAMGGKEIARTPAHADKRDDQITYEFKV